MTGKKWKKDLKRMIRWSSHYCPYCPVEEQEVVVLVRDLEDFIKNRKKVN